MFQFWGKGNKTISEVTEKQLKKNERVIKSLRDHDEGKKKISTKIQEADHQNVIQGLSSVLFGSR